MRAVLCLLIASVYCSSTNSSRIYHPEDDINYKRFMLLKNKAGDEEAVDLLSDQVTLQADLSHMTYYLYTKKNVNTPHIIKNNIQELSSSSSNFDPKKKTVFLIHGWVDSYTADVNTLTKQALFTKYDVNIIVVDWSPIAAESYDTAKQAVTTIGQFVGDFINNMIDKYGLTGSNFVLIGHSLGAHIAGNAGSAIKSPVGQIIGLDPAAPKFTVENTENRLDPTDAQYVQIIHTNGRFLGFSTSLGHADFYPNGGMVQAGCGIDLLGGCSHARAFQYLAEAIQGGKFTATLCGSYTDFQANKCANNRKVNMGAIDVDKSVVGDYFLKTNTAEPFAQG